MKTRRTPLDWMPMFPEERHSQICSLIEVNGRVTVPELAKRFGVTEDCIRKDLKTLAAAGKCQRVYGGATRVENVQERDINNRMELFEPEKRTIAGKALKLIQPEQTIYLDISSTNVQLARLLAQSGIPCTVVTPMLDVLSALARAPHIDALSLGGSMHAELNACLGSIALDVVRHYRFDLAFMGAYGVDTESHEITTYDTDDGMLKRAAIARAAVSYLVCESRKFSAIGTYTYADYRDFDAMICDDENDSAIAQIRASGLDVL